MPTIQPRRAGILVPVFAIRTAEDLGIGDTGGVCELIDWAAEIGLGFVQFLPINATGGDSSPYNAISSVALDYLTLDLSPAVVPELDEKFYSTITGILRPHVLPRQGGDTGFIDQIAAYDLLPAALKARIERLSVVYSYQPDLTKAKFGIRAQRLVQMSTLFREGSKHASVQSRAIHPLVYAQAAETALFDGMPRSVIATGLVDAILPVEQIGERLLAHITNQPIVKAAVKGGQPQAGGDKTVKYDQEDTGLGFRTDARLESYVVAQPTSCQMKRPGA